MNDEAKLSPKEWAREQRRAAYLRAKELRASDPKQLAFKEAMQERRREANQQTQARRTAAAKEQKARRADGRRAAQDRQLMMMIKPATGSE
jgi:hypothetical protein